jgi:SSS family solute:Na+ symporter/sodium/proline symporter
MLWAYTIYSAALTPVVLAAFYSKRVTAWGAVAAIAGGTIVTLTWDMKWVNESLPGIRALFPSIIADRDAIFPALFVAVGALIVVSLFTPPPTAAQLAQVSE